MQNYVKNENLHFLHKLIFYLYGILYQQLIVLEDLYSCQNPMKIYNRDFFLKSCLTGNRQRDRNTRTLIRVRIALFSFEQ
jgi:hypothetical protein